MVLTIAATITAAAMDLAQPHGMIAAESRYQRIEERARAARWDPAASPATHGGKIGTLSELQGKFGGRIPHREILRERTEQKRGETASERRRESDRRLLRFRDLPVPDTVSAGKLYCRTADLCIDAQPRRTRERRLKLQRRGESPKRIPGRTPLNVPRQGSAERTLLAAASEPTDAAASGTATAPPPEVRDPAAGARVGTGTYCRRGTCSPSLRPGRRQEDLAFRWSDAAHPPSHGGQPATVGELRERFDGTVPHRLILRVRTEIKNDLARTRRTQTFASRILQHLDLPVPDTVGVGKRHCRTEDVCVDPWSRRVTEQPVILRWGKARARASFFGGGVGRRKDIVEQRFGRKFTKRRRDMVPLAQRGDPPPQMRDQRFY